MVMNRRGQVFLMATIIIVGLMIGLVRVSNKSVSREEPEAFFDLADEIGFETKRVLDYGVISNSNSGALVQRLLENYSEIISNDDVAFVYGDSTLMSAYYYQSVNTIAVSGIVDTFTSITLSNRHVIQTIHDKGAGTSTVRIRGNDYTFNLKPGQNFYFVLIREEDDEQFVTVE